MGSRCSRCSLLIEPVWNRNSHTGSRRLDGSHPFNRTSMESKRPSGAGYPTNVLTFNRTSMESKPKLRSCLCWDCSLLIEPVWNRNHQEQRLSMLLAPLLIEPVWNRNDVNELIRLIRSRLLIEPVWNRNVGGETRWSDQHYLLIEPVWNRNAHSQSQDDFDIDF